MGTITSIRAAVPVAETSLPPLAEPHRAGIAPTGAKAVSAPLLMQAVQRGPSKPFTSDPQFLTARTTSEISAAEAAEAAREAYIKASIAAGISPLPLV